MLKRQIKKIKNLNSISEKKIESKNINNNNKNNGNNIFDNLLNDLVFEDKNSENISFDSESIGKAQNNQNNQNKNIVKLPDKKEFLSSMELKKIKKFSSNKKIIEKIKEEYNPLDNNHKYVMPYKKIKSERNIKFKIKRNSFLKIIKEIDNTKYNNNNNISTCSNNNKYRTLEEKGNRKRTNILKVTKKKNNKKDMEEELLIKPKFKIKKELIKLSSKLIMKKMKIMKTILKMKKKKMKKK